MTMFYSPLSDGMTDLLAGSRVLITLAARIAFSSGVTRVHGGTGTIVINGEAYLGLGALGEVGVVTEQHGTSPTQVSLTLTGLDSSLIATVLNERVVGRPVDIYLAAFDDDGRVAAANLLYRGRIASTGLAAGDKAAISYTVSNVFEDWQRGLTRRYSDESQRKAAPGDRIMRYVAQMAERSLFWGSKKDAPAFRYE